MSAHLSPLAGCRMLWLVCSVYSIVHDPPIFSDARRATSPLTLLEVREPQNAGLSSPHPPHRGESLRSREGREGHSLLPALWKVLSTLRPDHPIHPRPAEPQAQPGQQLWRPVQGRLPLTDLRHDQRGHRRAVPGSRLLCRLHRQASERVSRGLYGARHRPGPFFLLYFLSVRGDTKSSRDDKHFFHILYRGESTKKNMALSWKTTGS